MSLSVVRVHAVVSVAALHQIDSESDRQNFNDGDSGGDTGHHTQIVCYPTFQLKILIIFNYYNLIKYQQI